MSTAQTTRRPVALLTGTGRLRGIAAGIARRLADEGWDLALTHSHPYDASMPWASAADEPTRLADDLRRRGARVVLLPADLSCASLPDRLVAAAVTALGPLRGLVLSHAESRQSTILDTDVATFDHHLAVNARASWQLIRAFARRAGPEGGAVVALTGDDIEGDVSYGASKGALDRIVVAAARELGPRGIRANAVNPGSVDTGWMDAPSREAARSRQPSGRLGTPVDIARLVAFLLSDDGARTTGQLIRTDGGIAV